MIFSNLFSPSFLAGSTKRSLPFLFIAVLFLFICLSAWVGDDAFITARTVQNFLAGDGLRYNVTERVQTYTNPLLMLTLSFAVFFTKEFYFTLLFLNISASSVALYLLFFRYPQTSKTLFACFVFLVLSTAFKDYATSGLENSFGYLLCALFFGKFLTQKTLTQRSFLFLSFMTGLLLLNRMDTVLLVLPSLAFACFSKTEISFKKRCLILTAGLSPFILWEIFSVIYYGFPFPNTAYAKLGAGIPITEYLARGLSYYKFSLLFDSISLLGIAIALTGAFIGRKQRALACAGAGILLYLIYILYIGGDFMGGRFFALPFFVSVCLFPFLPFTLTPKKVLIPAALCVMASFFVISANSYASCFFLAKADRSCSLLKNGIYSERVYWKNFIYRFFYGDTETEDHSVIELYFQKNTPVQVYLCAGIIPFSRPSLHILDLFGLTDSLMARLPPLYKKDWRIGHIFRPLPKGYIDTLLSGKNVIRNKEIARYYDELKVVISGDLFSVERFKLIWKLNFEKNPLPTERIYFPVLTLQEKKERYGSQTDFEEIMLAFGNHNDLMRLQNHLKNYDLYASLQYPVILDIASVSSNSRLKIRAAAFEEEISFSTLTFSFFNTKTNAFESVKVPFSTEMDIVVPEKIKQSGFDKIMILKEDDPSKNLRAHALFIKEIVLTD